MECKCLIIVLFFLFGEQKIAKAVNEIQCSVYTGCIYIIYIKLKLLRIVERI